ncbi:fungal-specific transcription factor domain-containing protein [Exophiala viscosa]|uniref:Fungal-specific transcription factor domain-containing protein n=1 Tax=Exophiala viscosa TaxID=2486360 RepID=A0AAN6IAW4_9EURO|nr:fungal-specific transcription factor domain-containing protein [Exophiala viscosa]
MQKAGRPRRPRALQACEVCRARKNRCSEDQPCTYCVERELECIYSRNHGNKRKRTRPTLQFVHHVPATNSPHFAQMPVSGIIDFSPNDINQTLTLDERLGPQSRSMAVGQPQQQGAASTDENTWTTSTLTPRHTASEMVYTNLHTRNLEFYGSASSVAFLRHVETLSDSQITDHLAGPQERSLTSLLHNTDFQPGASRRMPSAPQDTDPNPDRFYFRVARRFLDAYFTNVHSVQPLFDEEEFLARCEDLWFNRPGKQPSSFVALYYATLSLGSLIMTFETPELSGADRFTWSRKLFNDALAIVTQLGTTTDIDMVQCLYMMSRICQHELEPHVAYLYSGQAARTSLAIGINRKSISEDAADPRPSRAASKTWWAVYCLDIQTSFDLGRPDSLGPDQYHTQPLPTATRAEPMIGPHILQIVPCTVGLSRLTRKVALDMYTQPCELDEKLQQANALDAELRHWFAQVPSYLRSEQPNGSDLGLKPRRIANYIKKQSVVLRLRYSNLRMVIHAAFMLDARRADETTFLRECQCRCISSAEDVIDLIYSTYRTDDYFQTWWYNTTYTLYAVSVLLAVIFRQLARTQPALEILFAHIDRAILVLEAMDECVVAINAAGLIKRTLVRAKKVPQPALIAQRSSSSQDAGLSETLDAALSVRHQPESENVDTILQSHPIDGLDLGETTDDIDWLNAFPFDDSQQALFWTEWAHEINTMASTPRYT